VPWIDELIPARGTRHPIRDIVTEHTLFGEQVVALGDGARRQGVRLTGHQDDLCEALVARLQGAAATGAELKDVAAIAVPLSPQALVADLQSHRDALAARLHTYRELRERIDEHVITALAQATV